MSDFPNHTVGPQGGRRPYIIGPKGDLTSGQQPVNLLSLSVLLTEDPDVSDVDVKGPANEPTRIEAMMDDITAAKYKALFGSRLTIEPDELLNLF